MRRNLKLSAIAALTILTVSCDGGRRVARVFDAMVDAAIDDSGDASAQDSGVSVDGSRLRARRIFETGSDGSSIDTGLVEITDTGLDTICARNATPMSDGTRRCLPTFVATAPPPNQLAIDYADSGCTMPLVTSNACSLPNPEFAIEQHNNTGTCAEGSTSVLRVYHVGAPFTGMVWRKIGSAGPCTQEVPANLAYHVRGAEMQPSEFVTLSR